MSHEPNLLRGGNNKQTYAAEMFYIIQIEDQNVK